MKKKILRSGNSLAVTIPSDFAKDLGLKAGDTVNAYLDRTQNKITYKFTGATQLPLPQTLFPKR